MKRQVRDLLSILAFRSIEKLPADVFANTAESRRVCRSKTRDVRYLWKSMLNPYVSALNLNRLTKRTSEECSKELSSCLERNDYILS